MQNKKTLILIPALAVVLAVSGCGKKEAPRAVVSNNTNVRQVNANVNENQGGQGGGAVEDGQSGEQGEQIDTSDWLTYRNEEYGFEVKYPEGWNEEKDRLLVYGSSQALNTEFYDGSFLEWFIIDSSDADEVISNIENNLLNSPNEELTLKDLQFEKKEINLSENKAFKLTYKMTYGGLVSEDSLITEVLISHNNKILKLVSTVVGHDYEKYNETADKIIGSIKFLDNNDSEEVDVSGWQIYRNDKYTFEFKHPIDWSIYSEKLNSFFPKVVANDEDGVVSEIGFFENKDNLEIEEWVDKNDFFKTKQYEDPEVFIDHSASNPVEIISQDGTIFKLYYGGGEGGLSFGTGITKINNKLIIFAYDLISYKGDLIKEKMEIFKNVIKSFRILK